MWSYAAVCWAIAMANGLLTLLVIAYVNRGVPIGPWNKTHGMVGSVLDLLSLVTIVFAFVDLGLWQGLAVVGLGIVGGFILKIVLSFVGLRLFLSKADRMKCQTLMPFVQQQNLAAIKNDLDTLRRE
jgi:hypothetical protein